MRWNVFWDWRPSDINHVLNKPPFLTCNVFFLLVSNEVIEPRSQLRLLLFFNGPSNYTFNSLTLISLSKFVQMNLLLDRLLLIKFSMQELLDCLKKVRVLFPLQEVAFRSSLCLLFVIFLANYTFSGLPLLPERVYGALQLQNIHNWLICLFLVFFNRPAD